MAMKRCARCHGITSWSEDARARPRLAGPPADLLLPGKARRVVQIPDDVSVLEMQLRREIELDRHAAETSDSAGGSEGASSRTEMLPLARPRDQERAVGFDEVGLGRRPRPPH